jgi:cerevisin
MVKLFTIITLLSFVFASVTAAPAPRPDDSPAASTTPSGDGTYIVLFNSSHPNFPYAVDVLSRMGLSADHDDVHTIYNNSAFRGFCASMKSDSVDALVSMSDVAVVEKCSLVSIADVRSESPWGLQRISSVSTVFGNPLG